MRSQSTNIRRTWRVQWLSAELLIVRSLDVREGEKTARVSKGQALMGLSGWRSSAATKQLVGELHEAVTGLPFDRLLHSSPNGMEQVVRHVAEAFHEGHLLALRRGVGHQVTSMSNDVSHAPPPIWWETPSSPFPFVVSPGRETHDFTTSNRAFAPSFFYAFVNSIEFVNSTTAFPRQGISKAGSHSPLYIQYCFDCIKARNFDEKVPRFWKVDPAGIHKNLNPAYVKKRINEQVSVIRGGNHCMIYVTVPVTEDPFHYKEAGHKQRLRLTNWYLLILDGFDLPNPRRLAGERIDDIPLDTKGRYFGDTILPVSVTHMETIPDDVRKKLLEVISLNHIPDVTNFPPRSNGQRSPTRGGPLSPRSPGAGRKRSRKLKGDLASSLPHGKERSR